MDTHINSVTCVCNQPDCQAKNCPKICGELEKFVVTGHHTHKPPANTTSEYLGPTDFKGKPKPQYYVKSKVRKEITKEQLQNDYTEDDLKQVKEATDYVNSSPSIFDKTK